MVTNIDIVLYISTSNTVQVFNMSKLCTIMAPCVCV